MDSLLGDLLVKSNTKIIVFNSMKRHIAEGIEKFAQKNYYIVES